MTTDRELASDRSESEDHRNQQLLLSGQLLSWIGDAMQPVAVAAALLLSGGSATDVGLATGAFAVGRLAATLTGGVLADRMNPVRLMIGADLIRAVLTMGLVWSVTDGPGHVGVMLVLLAVHGALGGVFLPALSVLKVKVTQPGSRLKFNSSVASAKTLATVIGPVVGGLLAAAAEPAVVFGLNGATFLVSAISLASMRIEAIEPSASTSFLRHLGEGPLLIARRRWLLVGMASGLIHSLAFGATITLMQVGGLSQHGSAGLGWIVAAQGVGTLVGVRLAGKLDPARPMTVAWTASLSVPICVLVLLWSMPLALVIGGIALAFIGVGVFSVLFETALQNNVPQDEIGRVASWDYVVSLATLPVGASVAGFLIDGVGLTTLGVVCMGTFTVASVVPLCFRDVRELPAHGPADS